MRRFLRGIWPAALAVAFCSGAVAQQAPAASPPPAAPAQPGPPPFATTKVEGTDNVYIFRYQNHQAMFVVTPKGVIATDPISYGRPQAAKTYIEEIQKITKAPIKYLIYSHHHYDHIAGGQPFKDAGAKIVAHKRTKERLEQIKDPATPLPDETFEKNRTIKLGGTTLELLYVGLNHSDSTLVMRLPKEKLIFVVDFIPIEGVQFRNIPDNASPLEYEESIKKVVAMDWDRMIPGHPYAGGRLGTKDDVRALKAYMTDLSDAVKVAADQGKCFDAAIKEIKLPKYEKWGAYEQYLPGNIERFCEYWARGY